MKALETEGFNAATQKIEGQTGKPFIAAQAGRLLEGTVSQKIELSVIRSPSSVIVAA